MNEIQETEEPTKKIRTQSQCKTLQLENVNTKGIDFQEGCKTNSATKSEKAVIGKSNKPSSSKNQIDRQHPTSSQNDTKTFLETDSSVSISSDSVLENLLNMQDTLLKPSQMQESLIKSDQNEANTKKFCLKPWSNTLKTDWQSHSQVR